MALAKPYSRWSGDTETAFLLALRLTGQVRRAAAEIGRATASAYTRRRRNPAFAAAWDAAVERHQQEWRVAAAAGGELRRAETRERFDGWTVVRRRAFLRALSETGDVREACQRVRISSTAAYRLRKASADFAHDWNAAIDRAAPMLEQVAFERAVDGWDEPVIHHGQVVAVRRRYSDSLLRTLLLREGGGGAGGGGRGKAPPGPAELQRIAQEAARAAGGMFSTDATRKDLTAKLVKALGAVQRGNERRAAEGGEGEG